MIEISENYYAVVKKQMSMETGRRPVCMIWHSDSNIPLVVSQDVFDACDVGKSVIKQTTCMQ